jgi:hypothetical protein
VDALEEAPKAVCDPPKADVDAPPNMEKDVGLGAPKALRKESNGQNVYKTKRASSKKDKQ